MKSAREPLMSVSGGETERARPIISPCALERRIERTDAAIIREVNVARKLRSLFITASRGCTCLRQIIGRLLIDNVRETGDELGSVRDATLLRRKIRARRASYARTVPRIRIKSATRTREDLLVKLKSAWFAE